MISNSKNFFVLYNKYQKNENFQSLNQDLLNYIDIFERNKNVSDKGKDILEVKKKSRTLNTFLTRAQNASWFSKSFGLKLQSMTVVETKIGKLLAKIKKKKKMGKLHIIGTEQAQGPSGVTSNNEEQSRGFEAIPILFSL